MSRVLPLLLILAVGCARPEPFRAYEAPKLKTAAEREQELKDNVRPDRSWADHEATMGDVKGAFGGPSDADATGPKKANPGR